MFPLSWQLTIPHDPINDSSCSILACISIVVRFMIPSGVYLFTTNLSNDLKNQQGISKVDANLGEISTSFLSLTFALFVLQELPSHVAKRFSNTIASSLLLYFKPSGEAVQTISFLLYIAIIKNLTCIPLHLFVQLFQR